MDNSTRLNKYLALQIGISRREADELISSGRVDVNGKVASLGERVKPSDEIAIDTKKISSKKEEYRYIMLNKPRGYVCSRRHQGSSPTIYDILPPDMRSLKTVGRLDKDSSGLIILTNDGNFTQQMTHPSFYKVKIYQATLDKPLEPLHHQMISDFGIQLEDGASRLQLDKIDDSSKNWIVTMHEGRNRQIRRTFAALGYEVVKLHRTNFGKYALGDIKSGKFVEVKI